MKVINKKDLNKEELAKRVNDLEKEVEKLKGPIKVKLYLGDSNDKAGKELWKRVMEKNVKKYR